MRHRLVLGLLLVLALLVSPLRGHAGVVVGPGGGTPGTSSKFKLVGHNPLFNRGMNAAPAIYEHYVYIGNRTDGSSTHPHPGIQIVDIADPSDPAVVGEIGSPHAGNVGITTRELRVWPEKKLLMVMTFRCSSTIHDCPAGNDTTFPFDIKFFDLSDPLNPRFISSYVPTSQAGTKVKPHEMYLWIDPGNRDRALLWLSTPSISLNPARPNVMIVDISDVPTGGAVREVAEGNWNDQFPGTDSPSYGPPNCDPYNCNLAVHSMGVSANGRRTYLAYLAGEFLVVDTSDVARRSKPRVRSLNDDLLTDPARRPTWTNPESHSAVKVPGRPFALTTDEVYGTFTDPNHGCPWGWSRTIDVTNEVAPPIVGEYKIAKNTCPADDEATQQFTSYASHNPTVLPNLALITWHSGGLQAIDISDAARPSQGGWFSPVPLDEVATEDPALSRAPTRWLCGAIPSSRTG